MNAFSATPIVVAFPHEAPSQPHSLLLPFLADPSSAGTLQLSVLASSSQLSITPFKHVYLHLVKPALAPLSRRIITPVRGFLKHLYFLAIRFTLNSILGGEGLKEGVKIILNGNA